MLGQCDQVLGFRFMSGKEIKKKKHLFGLRIRFPPGPQSSELPSDRASHEIKIKGRKSMKPPHPNRFKKFIFLFFFFFLVSYLGMWYKFMPIFEAMEVKNEPQLIFVFSTLGKSFCASTLKRLKKNFFLQFFFKILRQIQIINLASWIKLLNSSIKAQSKCRWYFVQRISFCSVHWPMERRRKRRGSIAPIRWRHWLSCGDQKSF